MFVGVFFGGCYFIVVVSRSRVRGVVVGDGGLGGGGGEEVEEGGGARGRCEGF